MGAVACRGTRNANDAAAEVRTLLSRMPRRQRLALAARILLDEADGCDRQLAILLKALARDEADSRVSPEAQEGTVITSAEQSGLALTAKLSRRRRETLDHLMHGLSE